MLLDDAVDDARAESLTVCLGGEERLEHTLPGRVIHADPRVRHFHDDRLPVAPGRQGDPAAVGQRLDGVEDEVLHHLRQLVDDARDHRDLGERGLDFDPLSHRLGLLLPLGPRDLDGVLDREVDVHRRLRSVLADPGVVLDAPDDLRGLQRRLDDRVQVGARLGRVRRVSREILAEDLGSGEDGGQRVVEVVRHAAGHLADGLDPLREDQLLLGGLERLIGSLQLVRAPRPFDGDRELTAEGEEMVDVAFIEAPAGLPAPESEDPQDPPVRPDRDAERDRGGEEALRGMQGSCSPGSSLPPGTGREERLCAHGHAAGNPVAQLHRDGPGVANRQPAGGRDPQGSRRLVEEHQAGAVDVQLLRDHVHEEIEQLAVGAGIGGSDRPRGERDVGRQAHVPLFLLPQQHAVLLGQGPLLEGSLHRDPDLVQVLERLSEVGVRPFLDGAQRALRRRVARHHDDFRVGRHPLDVGEEIETVLPGEHDIEQRDGGDEVGQEGEGFLGRGGLAGLAMVLLEDVHDDVADRLLVVDDEETMPLRRLWTGAHPVPPQQIQSSPPQIRFLER